MRRREVDVAAPDPFLRLIRHVPAHRERLRVVDDDHVPALVERPGVHLVVLLPGAPLARRQVERVALEGVVHQLGRVEELLAAAYHLPLGLDADVAHERYQRVEDLGNAAAERRRGQVEDLEALQLGRQLVDLLDQRTADEVRVVSQGLVTHPYGLKQGKTPLSREGTQTSRPCRRTALGGRGLPGTATLSTRSRSRG